MFQKRIPVPEGLISKLTEEQNKLGEAIVLTSLTKPITTIAGCDSSLLGESILSIFVVFTYPELNEIEVQYAVSKLTLPYIPGFLAFREIPNILKAYKKVQTNVDFIMVDGHGIMHPRRMGIASHLGVLLQKPTCGIAKKKLVGSFEKPTTVGRFSEVAYKNEHIGNALLTKARTNPIFVSPGNLCTLQDAMKITKDTLKGYKLPEPTRIADKYSKDYKKFI